MVHTEMKMTNRGLLRVIAGEQGNDFCDDLNIMNCYF